MYWESMLSAKPLPDRWYISKVKQYTSAAIRVTHYYTLHTDENVCNKKSHTKSHTPMTKFYTTGRNFQIKTYQSSTRNPKVMEKRIKHTEMISMAFIHAVPVQSFCQTNTHIIFHFFIYNSILCNRFWSLY